MSNILKKVFNPKSGFIRSIFRGTPALFTTSDLNRQIEATSYEFKQIRRLTGVTSDLKISVSVVESRLTNNGVDRYEGDPVIKDKNNITVTGISMTGTYIKIGNWTIPGLPPITQPTFPMTTNNSKKFFISLFAKANTIVSENDFSKEMSGVKFEDGTTAEGADSIVYSNPKIVITNSETLSESNLPTGEEFLGLLAIVSFPANVNWSTVNTVRNSAIKAVSVHCVDPNNCEDCQSSSKGIVLEDIKRWQGTILPTSGTTLNDAVSMLSSFSHRLESSLFNRGPQDNLIEENTADYKLLYRVYRVGQMVNIVGVIRTVRPVEVMGHAINLSAPRIGWEGFRTALSYVPVKFVTVNSADGINYREEDEAVMYLRSSYTGPTSLYVISRKQLVEGREFHFSVSYVTDVDFFPFSDEDAFV